MVERSWVLTWDTTVNNKYMHTVSDNMLLKFYHENQYLSYEGD